MPCFREILGIDGQRLEHVDAESAAVSQLFERVEQQAGRLMDQGDVVRVVLGNVVACWCGAQRRLEKKPEPGLLVGGEVGDQGIYLLKL
jgi:hypothetical protein